VFYTQLLCTFIILTLHTNCHVSVSAGPLVIFTKLKARRKYSHDAIFLLLYIPHTQTI